jgi:hypothetical protein
MYQTVEQVAVATTQLNRPEKRMLPDGRMRVELETFTIKSPKSKTSGH